MHDCNNMARPDQIPTVIPLRGFSKRPLAEVFVDERQAPPIGALRSKPDLRATFARGLNISSLGIAVMNRQQWVGLSLPSARRYRDSLRQSDLRHTARYAGLSPQFLDSQKPGGMTSEKSSSTRFARFVPLRLRSDKSMSSLRSPEEHRDFAARSATRSDT